MYRGHDPASGFVKRVQFCNNLFREHFEIVIPLQPEIVGEIASQIGELYINCFYCNETIGGDNNLDYDHLNGKYRGYAHEKCCLDEKTG